MYALTLDTGSSTIQKIYSNGKDAWDVLDRFVNIRKAEFIKNGEKKPIHTIHVDRLKEEEGKLAVDQTVLFIDGKNVKYW